MFFIKTFHRTSHIFFKYKNNFMPKSPTPKDEKYAAAASAVTSSESDPSDSEENEEAYLNQLTRAERKAEERLRPMTDEKLDYFARVRLTMLMDIVHESLHHKPVGEKLVEVKCPQTNELLYQLNCYSDGDKNEDEVNKILDAELQNPHGIKNFYQKVYDQSLQLINDFALADSELFYDMYDDMIDRAVGEGDFALKETLNAVLFHFKQRDEVSPTRSSRPNSSAQSPARFASPTTNDFRGVRAADLDSAATAETKKSPVLQKFAPQPGGVSSLLRKATKLSMQQQKNPQDEQGNPGRG